MIQHEMDHLDGVLILDRTSRDQRKQAMRALREALEPPRRPRRSLRNVYLGTSEFAAVVLRAAGRLRRTARSSSSRARTPRRAAARSSRRRRWRCSRASSASRSSSPSTCTRPRCSSGSRRREPEVLTTCAYGVLIKEPLLSDYEMINVHPSLLPRWRGAAPIERAIMAGDAETGVTIMRVTAGWDSGPVYLRGDRADPPGRRLRHARRRGWRRSAPSCSCKALDEHPTPRRAGRGARHLRAQDRRRASARWTRRSRREEVERTVRALRPHIGARLPLPDGTLPRRDRRARRRPDPRARRRPASAPRATGCCSTATAARSS